MACVLGIRMPAVAVSCFGFQNIIEVIIDNCTLSELAMIHFMQQEFVVIFAHF